MTQLVELTRRHIGARARCNSRDAGKSKATCASASDALFHPKIDEDLLARSLSGRDRDELNRLLRRCHEMLIEPFEQVLAGEPRLLIVPDGDLYALPFAALRGKDEKHLIERHTLSLSPSLGTIVELERKLTQCSAPAAGHIGTDRPSALVVGDPEFHGGWLSQLPGALQEAVYVARRLRASSYDTKALFEGDATKPSVLEAMPNSNILHFATHGSPDGIYLSGESEQEGTLSMAEVQELDLTKARLVVLSECDSFRGQLCTDGVVGITRAFVAAGAPTLVSSLWEVNDLGTRILMHRFYERLLGRASGDAAVALQGAMASMIREDYEVSTWAPFVVYGLTGFLSSVTVHPLTSSSSVAAKAEGNVILREHLMDLLTTPVPELARLAKDQKLLESIVQAALDWCAQNGYDRLGGVKEAGKVPDLIAALNLKLGPKRFLWGKLNAWQGDHEAVMKEQLRKLLATSIQDHELVESTVKAALAWCAKNGYNRLGRVKEAGKVSDLVAALDLDRATKLSLIDRLNAWQGEHEAKIKEQLRRLLAVLIKDPELVESKLQAALVWCTKNGYHRLVRVKEAGKVSDLVAALDLDRAMELSLIDRLNAWQAEHKRRKRPRGKRNERDRQKKYDFVQEKRRLRKAAAEAA